jgi:hypothetical protein
MTYFRTWKISATHSSRRSSSRNARPRRGSPSRRSERRSSTRRRTRSNSCSRRSSSLPRARPSRLQERRRAGQLALPQRRRGWCQLTGMASPARRCRTRDPWALRAGGALVCAFRVAPRTTQPVASSRSRYTLGLVVIGSVSQCLAAFWVVSSLLHRRWTWGLEFSLRHAFHAFQSREKHVMSARV